MSVPHIGHLRSRLEKNELEHCSDGHVMQTAVASSSAPGLKLAADFSQANQLRFSRSKLCLGHRCGVVQRLKPLVRQGKLRLQRAHAVGMHLELSALLAKRVQFALLTLPKGLEVVQLGRQARNLGLHVAEPLAARSEFHFGLLPPPSFSVGQPFVSTAAECV
jgi:hypothetical protein